MGIYVGLARRMVGGRAAAPVGRDPPARLCVVARLPFRPRSRSLQLAINLAAGRDLPGPPRHRPAGRGGLRAADGLPGGRVREPVLPVHRIRRALPVRDRTSSSGSRWRSRLSWARGVSGACGVAIVLALGGGFALSVATVFKSVALPAAFVFFAVEALALLVAPAAGWSVAAVVGAPAIGALPPPAVALARRAGRACGGADTRRLRAVCTRANDYQFWSPATRWAPTSCSATTGASRTSNG